jgi:3-oxoacyl-[acyl-carrier protein] reductase
MTDLSGKKTLVTGGTAGIGRDIALHFAAQGANVAIFGRNEERAKETIAALEASRVSNEQIFSGCCK